MPPVRILAVDHGDRRTGLAATDYTGTIVTPLPPVHATSADECARAVADVAGERETELIVVGLPLTTGGEIGPRAKVTQGFVARLSALVPCPVTTVDERFSTDEAHDLLKQAGLKAARRKHLADSTAALVLLHRYRQTAGDPP